MKIYITSDHGGFELKNKIVDTLRDQNINIIDLGPKTLNEEDDYPIYAKNISLMMQQDPDSKGIVLCKNGVGISIAANKFKGIRCALSFNPEHIKSAVHDDDANMLSLAAKYIEEETALDIVNAFVNTEYVKTNRYERRLAELKKLENEKV